MRLYGKLILAALTTTAVLAVAIGGATARNISTNERNFEIEFDGALGQPKTNYEFIVVNQNIQCPLTMLGSFLERTIKKETGLAQVHIFHAEAGTCTNGTATVKTETLPWSGHYRGFTGTLPSISSVSFGLIGASFRVRESGGLVCEATTEVNHPGVFIIGNSTEATETGFETRSEPKNVTGERGNRIPLRGEFLCSFAGEAESGGIGLLTNLPRTAFLHITLI